MLRFLLLVLRQDFAIAPGDKGSNDADADAALDERHRPVTPQDVHAAGVERIRLPIVGPVDRQGPLRPRRGGIIR
jgi:hypothetical protein